MKEVLYMEEFFENVIHANLVKTVIFFVISIVLYEIIKKAIEKMFNSKKINKKRNPKKATYIKLINNIFKYVYFIAAVLILLQINGVDVSSFIAGIGIAGVVVGLALQDALKDIIMGTNIIMDNFFVVGDTIKYNDIEGKVIELGLKTTKIMDIKTNSIVCITNRNIDKVINVSNELDILIPLPYEEKVERIESILNEVTNKIKDTNELVKDCKYLGVDEFADSCIKYRIRVYCTPEKKPEIKRFANKCIKVALDENDINIPYQQVDICLKKN